MCYLSYLHSVINRVEAYAKPSQGRDFNLHVQVIIIYRQGETNTEIPIEWANLDQLNVTVVAQEELVAYTPGGTAYAMVTT